jgi:hypothetical protein
MSYAANEKQYLELIRQFLNSEIDVDIFCERFSSLWRVDRDEEWSKVENLPERPDVKLTEAFNRGEISGEVFQQKWRKLFDSESYEALATMTDRIFTACDVFREEPEAEYEIDETELRREVAEHLAIYESAKSKQLL